MFQLVILLSIIGLTFGQTNFCNISSCGTSHIACNNNGSFSSVCVQPQLFVLNQTLIDEILNQHNTARNTAAIGGYSNLPTAIRMGKMAWSSELATMADFNVKTCVLQADCHNTPSFIYSGINVQNFVSSVPRTAQYLINTALNSWISRHVDTRQSDINAIANPSATGKRIYSFTGIVTDRNIRVGCALSGFRVMHGTTLMYSYLFACDYASTNILTYPVYKTGPTGANCTLGTDATFSGLCNVAEPINPNSVTY